MDYRPFFKIRFIYDDDKKTKKADLPIIPQKGDIIEIEGKNFIAEYRKFSLDEEYITEVFLVPEEKKAYDSKEKD